MSRREAFGNIQAEIGELLVGAYLKVVEECDVVSYNVRPPGGLLQGMEELDVVGLRFRDRTAFLCEVTTHLLGALYVNNRRTVEKILQKHERQQRHAERFLQDFPTRRYMFWSPRVSKGYVTNELRRMEELKEMEVVVNEEYTDRIDLLRKAARKRTNDEGNDAFRLLQILEHLRR